MQLEREIRRTDYEEKNGIKISTGKGKGRTRAERNNRINAREDYFWKIAIWTKEVEAEEKIVVMKKKKKKMAVKLPKLELKEYDGNIWKWTEFSDTFNYLNNQLNGNLSKVLSGFRFIKDNYYVAVELPKRRYEKKHVMTMHTTQSW